MDQHHLHGQLNQEFVSIQGKVNLQMHKVLCSFLLKVSLSINSAF
jgi:hypothetical protein